MDAGAVGSIEMSSCRGRQAAAQPALKSFVPRATKRPVTVVIRDEDRRVLAEGWALVLADESGIEVVGLAASVAERLQQTVMTAPDVVLIDYAVPDDESVVDTSTLNKTRAKLKLVMLTSYTNEASKVESGAEGHTASNRADVVEETQLTRREREVLELLAEGASTQSMAERLFLSINTIRNLVQHILTKLGAHSRLEAVSTAVRKGIIVRS